MIFPSGQKSLFVSTYQNTSIPTDVGSTALQSCTHPVCTVHPRVRGEHFVQGGPAIACAGSSPHARGTREGEMDDSVFQSTRPRGARRCGTTLSVIVMVFQSTRPRGARPHNFRSEVGSHLFQSTRPRGARPAETASLVFRTTFQSTRPRGARRRTRLRSPTVATFQSTRPRGARRGRNAARQYERRVSIHAPARGATYRRLCAATFYDGFNPRARAGRDLTYIRGAL